MDKFNVELQLSFNYFDCRMKKYLSIPILLVFAVIFPSCAVFNPASDYMKQRYTNAIAYFNTYYNAQRAFQDAEEEAIAAKKDFLDKQTKNKIFSIPQTARTKFTASIEKNSKLLSYYPTSKWVDASLLMIGKAYYYTDDDLKAERKYLSPATKQCTRP